MWQVLLWRMLPAVVAMVAASLYFLALKNGRLPGSPSLYHDIQWAPYHTLHLLQAVAPFSIGLSKSTIVNAYIKRETPIAQAGILANIGPNGSKCGGAKPGTVIASPSTEDPDYLYTWTRDAALVMKLLVDHYTHGKDRSLRSLINDYVTAQAALQNVPNPSGGMKTGGLGEPKFNINHTAFTDPWGRPQHDGPALRAITLITYAKWLLEKPNQAQVSKVIWPVIQKDLDYVVNYWNRTGFDLWEEVSSSSFFTTAVQHRALREGAALAHYLTEVALADVYFEQAENTLCFMQSYWNAEDLYITSNTGGGRSGKDANSVLASIHTFDPSAGCDATTFQPCSDKALASLSAYIDTFRTIYGINQDIPPTEAVATGRYSEDIYMGGHPWYLTTAAVAEQLYDAIYVWKAQRYIEVTNISTIFFQLFIPDIEPGRYRSRTYAFSALIEDIKEYADGFIAVNAKYTPWDGSLSEQYHRDNGKPLSALDLTWSYAASLTAFNARAEVLRPVSWGAKGLTVPSVCRPNPPKLITVTFVVHAETVPGENIYVTGSIEALHHWSTGQAVKLSPDKYPIWRGAVKVPAESILEYKYVRKIGRDGEVTWEEGSNRFLETPLDANLETRDSWR